MSWYYLEKEFYDNADDIEGVNVHYVWTPLGSKPDWENQRATHYMPLVHSPAQLCSTAGAHAPPSEVTALTPARLRKKVLKLPQQILDPQRSTLTDRYLLHHYFEIFQDGHRHYSPLYTEEVITGAGTRPLAHEPPGEVGSSPSSPAPVPDPKESNE